MDSITQAVLRAAVGEATLGRRVGNKAPLWGAVLGTLVWRVVGVNSDGYFEGFWSLINPEKGLTLTHYEHRLDLLRGIEQSPSVQRLQWFTNGLYRVVPDGNGVVISDLRMGVDRDYVFAFRVAEMSNPHPRPIVPERVRTEQDLGRLRGL